MKQALVVRGRLVGPTSVELDEPVTQASGEVEVVVHLPGAVLPDDREDIFDIIASLPGGNRTKEDIDRQVRDERESWGDR